MGSVGTPGVAGQAGHCQGSQHYSWAFGLEMETPVQQDSLNFHTSLCVFEESVLRMFTVVVVHNVVTPIHEMHTFLSVPIVWELLTLMSNIFSALMENVSWCSLTGVLYELGFFASSSHG